MRGRNVQGLLVDIWFGGGGGVRENEEKRKKPTNDITAN